MKDRMHLTEHINEEVNIPVERNILVGNLSIPAQASGLVLFAHGSGSGRKSERNQSVAKALNDAGVGTLLFDLLTIQEEKIDSFSAQYRFNIQLLATRLVCAIDWAKRYTASRQLKLGLFGASTGAAAALVAAAERNHEVFAVVSRGGRPDLAGEKLRHVFVPTLLLVGGEDHVVIELNKAALEKIPGEKRLIIIPGATHLFEEPGKLEEVSQEATRWFHFFLGQQEAKELFLDRK